MIQTVKASKLFSLVPEQSPMGRVTWMKIPVRRIPDVPDCSLILLELMVLTACIRITKAKRMFEFGTFLGNTTLHMAMNSPEYAEIWTLDADDETLVRHKLLDTYSWRNCFPLEFADTPFNEKIHVLREDSHTFEPRVLTGTMDLVLIDGDHSGKGVARDTANTILGLMKCRYPYGDGCILWHDYRTDRGCADNVAFLDGLAEYHHLVHIEDTALVVSLWANGKSLL